MTPRNSLISALRHSLYRSHEKSEACAGCTHAEKVLVDADRTGQQPVLVGLDLLWSIEEFLDDYSDVKDGPEGPVPNRAMSLLNQVREVLGEGEGGAEAVGGSVLDSAKAAAPPSAPLPPQPAQPTEATTPPALVEGHADEGGAPELGRCRNTRTPHSVNWFCRNWQPEGLLDKLKREVLG